MTDAEAADVVRRHLAAFTDGDLAGLVESLAPDAEFVTGTTIVPPAAFATFFGDAIRDLAPRIEITRLIAGGEDVAVEFVESLTLDGRFQRLTRAAFYTVRVGRVVRAKVYDERH